MENTSAIDAWNTLTTRARLALLVLVIAILVFLWSLKPIFAALFAPSLQEAPVVTQPDGEIPPALLADLHALNDRSPFFPPVEPPKPYVRPDPGPVVERDPQKGPYAGPKLIGLVSNQAVFDRAVNQSDQYLKVGQKGSGLELVSIELPWTATVMWNSFEYELNLFERIEPGTGMPFPGTGGTAPLSNVFNNNRPNRGTAGGSGSTSAQLNAAAGGAPPPPPTADEEALDFSFEDN